MAKEKKTIKTTKHTRSLKVQLTDKDVLGVAEELSKVLDEIKAIDEEKKAVVANLKSRTEEKEARCSTLQSLVRNKWEYRPVDCEETMDNNTGKVTTRRLDTDEVIEERDMTYDERQSKLFDDEAA